MNNPQERIIKKMIDNIVEQNKPVFEKPGEEPARSVATSPSTPAAEESGILARKIEYGFTQMRQEHADLRKLLEEVGGAVRMLRSDLDMLKSSMHQRPRPAEVPAQQAEPQQSGAAMGAPQYRKSAADEAYERETGESSHHDEPVPPNQHGERGSQAGKSGVDISKVFYYGKK